MGLKTLIVSAVAYLLLVMGCFSISAEMLTASSTVENVVGVGVLVLLVVGTLALIPFFKKLSINSWNDLQNLLPLLFIGFVALNSQGCVERIDPGYVGIKVNLTGDDKGVSTKSLVNGRVFYNPLTTDILEYPTFVQTAKWTKDVAESATGGNEEITFNSRENLAISGDISLSYAIDRDRVPEFYVKYRSDDLKAFTHGMMRNVARDAFNEIGGTLPVEDIMGPKKEQFLELVKIRVNERMKSVGVKIDQFGFIGAIRPPANVIAAINAKLAAVQVSIQAENELRTAEAYAKQAVAKAQGEAASQIARAEGAAKAQIASAEGTAKANKILQESISPTLIEWRKLSIQEQTISRWNGVRPLVESGTGQGLLLNVPVAK